MLYRYKPVVQVDLETGKTVKFWMSGTEAARHIMVAQSAISLCARGGRKEAAAAPAFASDEDIRAQDEINAKLEQEEKERKEKQRQASGEDNTRDDDDGGGGGGEEGKREGGIHGGSCRTRQCVAMAASVAGGRGRRSAGADS